MAVMVKTEQCFGVRKFLIRNQRIGASTASQPSTDNVQASGIVAMIMKTAFAAGAAIAMLCFGFASAQANDKLIEMAKNPKDWVIPLGNYAGHRYSALDQINESNVSKLQVAWMFSTGVLRGHEGAPLKIGNMMYLVTPFPNNVMAIDLDNENKIAWQYMPKQSAEVSSIMFYDTVNRGLAYADGLLFLNQADTTLVAIDAKTGKARWTAINGDPKIGETGTAAPLVVKDKVLVGISGGAFGARCHVTAYVKETGKLSWRAYATGSDNEILFDPDKTSVLGKPAGANSSLNSWSGDDWKHSGGCAWGWITYDPELNLIYYGTGAPAPGNAAQRPGDNRWTSSIIARDADTGVAQWVYQTTPHDEWGYAAVSEPILVELPEQGAAVGAPKRKALVHFNSNGFAYVLDRSTGDLISADPWDWPDSKSEGPNLTWAGGVETSRDSSEFGRPTRDPRFATKPDVNTKGICPANRAGGAKGAQPAAWHPQLQTFIVPTAHQCMDLEPYNVNLVVGQNDKGTTTSPFPAKNSGHMGSVVSWVPARTEGAWHLLENYEVTSGALTTAGNVAFYGTQDRYLKAVRISDSKELFKLKTPSGIIGNPISFEHRGKQYIGILSGFGGDIAMRRSVGDGATIFDPLDAFVTAPDPLLSVKQSTNLGGTLVVFALPDSEIAPQKAIPAAAPTPARP